MSATSGVLLVSAMIRGRGSSHTGRDFSDATEHGIYPSQFSVEQSALIERPIENTMKEVAEFENTLHRVIQAGTTNNATEHGIYPSQFSLTAYATPEDYLLLDGVTPLQTNEESIEPPLPTLAPSSHCYQANKRYKSSQDEFVNPTSGANFINPNLLYPGHSANPTSGPPSKPNLFPSFGFSPDYQSGNLQDTSAHSSGSHVQPFSGYDGSDQMADYGSAHVYPGHSANPTSGPPSNPNLSAHSSGHNLLRLSENLHVPEINQSNHSTDEASLDLSSLFMKDSRCATGVDLETTYTVCLSDIWSMVYATTKMSTTNNVESFECESIVLERRCVHKIGLVFSFVCLCTSNPRVAADFKVRIGRNSCSVVTNDGIVNLTRNNATIEWGSPSNAFIKSGQVSITALCGALPSFVNSIGVVALKYSTEPQQKGDVYIRGLFSALGVGFETSHGQYDVLITDGIGHKVLVKVNENTPTASSITGYSVTIPKEGTKLVITSPDNKSQVMELSICKCLGPTVYSGNVSTQLLITHASLVRSVVIHQMTHMYRFDA